MKIIISHTAFSKIMYWIDKADFEVSGMGLVEFDEKTDAFTVTDAFLLKQEGGAAHTDIDAQALAKLMFTTKDRPGQLHFWWHSHVNMAAFWSTTDLDTIKELGAQGWMTASVFNKRREHKSAYCCLADMPPTGNRIYCWDDVATEISKAPLASEITESEKLIALLTKEIEDLKKTITEPLDLEFTSTVTKKTFSASNYYSLGADPKTGERGKDTAIDEAELLAVLEYPNKRNDPGLYWRMITEDARALNMKPTVIDSILDSGNQKQRMKLAKKLYKIMYSNAEDEADVIDLYQVENADQISLLDQEIREANEEALRQLISEKEVHDESRLINQ